MTATGNADQLRQSDGNSLIRCQIPYFSTGIILNECQQPPGIPRYEKTAKISSIFDTRPAPFPSVRNRNDVVFPRTTGGTHEGTFGGYSANPLHHSRGPCGAVSADEADGNIRTLISPSSFDRFRGLGTCDLMETVRPDWLVIGYEVIHWDDDPSTDDVKNRKSTPTTSNHTILKIFFCYVLLSFPFLTFLWPLPILHRHPHNLRERSHAHQTRSTRVARGKLPEAKAP